MRISLPLYGKTKKKERKRRKLTKHERYHFYVYFNCLLFIVYIFFFLFFFFGCGRSSPICFLKYDMIDERLVFFLCVVLDARKEERRNDYFR